MNSVDRVYAALYHEEPDKIPYMDGFWGDAGEKFLGDELRKIKDPWKQGLFLFRFFDNDILLYGIDNLFTETISIDENISIIKSVYGAIAVLRKRPYMFKVLHYPIKYKEDLSRVQLPELEVLRDKIEALKPLRELIKGEDIFLVSGWAGPFTYASEGLRGLKNFLVDVIKDPDFAKQQLELFFKTQIETIKMLIDLIDIDAVYISDDLGDNISSMISPKVFRKLIKPLYREIVNTSHRKGKHVFLHSHGNIGILLGELVEIGFDVVNPFDPAEGNDLAGIKEKYGDKLTIMGGISKQIDTMNKRQLREHLEDRVKTAAPGGGYILQSAGGVPRTMSMENFYYYRELIQKLRNYPKLP